MKGKCEADGEFTDVDRCHIRSRGAGAGWEDHEIILMCRKHHIESGQMGWYSFTKKYPRVMEILIMKGWILKNEFGVSKLRRK